MIVAAIGMSDRGDDPLAIHVVASSVLNLLRELIEKGGDDYVERASSSAYSMPRQRARKATRSSKHRPL